MLLIVILVLAVLGNSQPPYPCSTKYTISLDRCSYGSLQICWSGEGSSELQWYSVCSSSSILNDAADDDDAAAAVAAVVCGQLGFNSAAGNRRMFG